MLEIGSQVLNTGYHLLVCSHKAFSLLVPKVRVKKRLYVDWF